MKMQKFFRKHSKALMGVMGAILILAWLAPCNNQGSGRDGSVNKMLTSKRYGDINTDDAKAAQQTTQFVGILNPQFNWRTPIDGRLPRIPLELVDWVLLEKEAQAQGFDIPVTAVEGRFSEPQSQAYLANAAASNRVRQDLLLSGYADAMSVQALADFTSMASGPSLAETRQIGFRTLEKVKVNAAILPAGAFMDEEATFTDDQIKTQYEAYKSNVPGSGMDFGYVLGDAVKVEYIEIDRKIIEANLKVDEVKVERDARKFWQENRTHPVFRKPVEAPKPDGSTAADTDDAAAKPAVAAEEPAPPPAEEKKPDGGGPRADASAMMTQEGGAQPPPAEKPAEPAPASKEEPGSEATVQDTKPVESAPQVPAPVVTPESPKPPAAPPIAYFESWEEARDAAMKHIRQQQTAETAQRITDWMLKRLDDPWIGIKPGEDGYKPAPDAVKSANYYETVAAQAVKEFGYAEAIKVGRTNFFSREEASGIPGLGQAMSFEQGRLTPSGLVRLAFFVQGLVQLPKGADMTRFLALHQTSRHYLNAVTEGKGYVFRVIETRKSRPPESVDEVRERVVKDLRMKAGYDAARAKAEALLAAAKNGSLKEAFEADESLTALKEKNVKFTEPRPFSRMSGALNTDLSTKNNVSIMDIGAVSPDVAEKMFALANDPEHRALIPLDARATILAIEWIETLPARIDEFDKWRSTFAQRAVTYRSTQAKDTFARPSNVRARAGVADLE